MKFVVYQITKRDTKQFYIGKTSLARWLDGYMGGGRHITNAVNKHGRGAFYRAILATFDSEKEALDFERECVVTKDADPLSYNLQDGGIGGANPTLESRAKMSKSSTGKKHTPDTIEKCRASSTGREVTAETRAKLRDARLGAVVSPETCAKLSESHKGKKASPETRAKMSESTKISMQNPETRARISESGKAAWVIRKQKPTDQLSMEIATQ